MAARLHASAGYAPHPHRAWTSRSCIAAARVPLLACKAKGKGDAGSADLSKLVEPTLRVLTGVAGQIVDADAARQGISTSSGSGSVASPKQDCKSPVYALVAVQALACLTTCVLDLLPASALGLSVRHPQWWQLVTNTFLFSNAQHLAETVFLTYVLGRLVERSHGALGLWAAFLASTLGANLMTLAFAPQRLSAAPFATSAGVLGLFVVGLLVPRLTLKPLEVACLAPFVCASAFSRSASLAGLAVYEGAKVGQFVHAAGALAGSLLVFGLLTLYRKHLDKLERQAQAKQAEEQQQAMTDVLNTAARAATNAAKRWL